MFMINNRANRCSNHSSRILSSGRSNRRQPSVCQFRIAEPLIRLRTSNLDVPTSNLQLAHNNKLQLTQWSWVLLLIFLLWKCVQHRIGITDEFVLNLTWAKFRLAGDSQSLPAMGSAVWSPESSEGSRVRSLLSQKFWQKRSSGLILAN